MFKCKSCNSIFEEPLKVATTYREYPGAGGMSDISVEICPCCDSACIIESDDSDESDESVKHCTFCHHILIALDDDKSIACDHCGAVWEKTRYAYVLVCEPQVEEK